MASIKKLPRKRKDGSRGHAWKVRYRDPDRVERSRTFRTEADARRNLASQVRILPAAPKAQSARARD